jgi:hypothetical protein
MNRIQADRAALFIRGKSSVTSTTMSAPENHDTRGRLLTLLFWGGIGLAPLAALLLIVVGSSTAGLRFAALLAILAVVAIGLSVTLRRDASSIKLDIEETLLDEIDMLRNDVRADITTAARATHRALSEKMGHLHESVDHVRRQVDAAGFLELDRAPAAPPMAPPPRRPAVGSAAPPGLVQRTETVRVTTRTIVDPDEDHANSRGNGHRPALPRGPQQYDDAESAGVRGHRDDRQPARGALQARDDSWPGQRVVRNDFESAARQSWRDHGEDGDPGNDPRWSAMRGGDRWAEVRQDEHGRELRMAERRTAIRTDETGTQMRIVDRWSTVREERPRSSDPVETFENTGETRAQRRARVESEDPGSGAGRGQWTEPDEPRDRRAGGRRSDRDDESRTHRDDAPSWQRDGRDEARGHRDDSASRGRYDDEAASRGRRIALPSAERSESRWDEAPSWSAAGRSSRRGGDEPESASRVNGHSRHGHATEDESNDRSWRDSGSHRAIQSRHDADERGRDDEWRAERDRDDQPHRSRREAREQRTYGEDQDRRSRREDRDQPAYDERDDRGSTRSAGRGSSPQPARDTVRDSGFVPRPLDQHRWEPSDDHGFGQDDRGYAAERIPVQRAGEAVRGSEGRRPESRRAADSHSGGRSRDHEDGSSGRSTDHRDPSSHREAPADRNGRGLDWPPRDGVSWDTTGRREAPAARRDAAVSPAGPRDSQPPQQPGTRPSRRDDDDRWEREPSGQRSQMRRSHDFDVADERWR